MLAFGVILAFIAVSLWFGVTTLKIIDTVWSWFDESNVPMGPVARILSACAGTAWYVGGFQAAAVVAALTLGLWPLIVGIYCLGKYRPHWYTIWSAFKCAFAVTISPLLLMVFWRDKLAFINLMSRLWPHIDIYTPEGELYLRRWFMTPKGQSYRPRFLHLILLSDEGRDPHDHPGAFSTTILMNGYDEEIYIPLQPLVDLPPGVWNGRPGNPLIREARVGDTLDNPDGHTHVVKLIGPTLTWLVGWRKGKPWGFWVMDPLDPSKDQWIESEAYGDKGEERKSWTIDGK